MVDRNPGARVLDNPAYEDALFREYDGPSGGGLGADDALLSYRRFLASIVKMWKLILLLTIVGAVAGVVVTLLTPPTYQAVTTVQVDRQSSTVLNVEGVEPVEQAMEAERNLQTQIELIRSRSVASQVAQNLNLVANDDFIVAMGGKPLATEGVDPRQLRERRQRIVVSMLQGGVDVESSRTSRIIRIIFRSRSPQVSARVANAYAETYIASNLNRRTNSFAFARNFLERRLAETQARLEDSERAIIAYARSAELIDAGNGASSGDEGGGSNAPASLAVANLVNINSAYASARSKRLQAEQRWQQARGSAIFSLPDVLNNTTIQQLTQRRAQLQAEYQEKGRLFRPDYPVMVQLAAQIAEVGRQIDREAANVRSAIRTEFEVARDQENALQREVTALKSTTLDEQRRSIQYNILRREADTNRTLYDALLQRFKEISTIAGSQSNNITVVDPAVVPGAPTSPKPLINLLLASLLGLGLGILIALARERFDDTIRTPADLSEKLGVPLIGTVPKITDSGPILDVLRDVRSELSEGYASVRTALQFSTAHGAPKSILVTSSRPSEGKTTTSFATALSFTRLGKRVLLVDSDLRNPSVHSAVDLKNTAGTSDVLSGQARPEEVVRETEFSNLSVITAGPIPPDPSMLLSGTAMATMIDMLAARFDLIVVDGPPVMGLADVPLISRAVDGVMFVIESGKTRRGMSRASLDRLHAAQAPIIGALITKFDQRNAAYGTDYHGAYEYRYKARN